jgi:hypothetical protein
MFLYLEKHELLTVAFLLGAVFMLVGLTFAGLLLERRG